jgi:PIN domain nuclease of toxin-antitoxin system
LRLLLDTHALLWWAHEPAKLSAAAAQAVADGENDVLVSAVSAMEIAIKDRKGALEYRTELSRNFAAEVTGQGFGLLSISCDHAERAGGYVGHHQDPWDRLLAAQAQLENLIVVTCDEQLASFGARTLW